MEKVVKDGGLFKLLERVDAELAAQAREGGCERCGGKLHRGDFPRKPRGGPEWDERYSFDCSRCRKRKTPASVRFLGRKVYVGLVVVLISAMTHGLSARRVETLRAELGIDVRTLKRWRQWWLARFTESSFWKAARGRLMPPADEQRLPLSLVDIFRAREREGLLNLMKFLAPITTDSCKEVAVM